MQPYFLPYIGYFQLVEASDCFVIYDNIQYSKGGWINRNQYLLNNKSYFFTIPIKKDSDFLDIRDRKIAINNKEKELLLRKFKAAYHKSPYFNSFFPILEQILSFEDRNLFNYIHHSILSIKNYLQINTEIIVSSDLEIDHSKKSQEKIINICKKINTDLYINPIGGKNLYDADEFMNSGLNLKFLKPNLKAYKQFNNNFVKSLSIVDVLMFNSVDVVKQWLREYELQE